MTKKNKRRGFTIVELVIVIAVIAILAAVLIPTYVNLVKKANEAKAQAEAKNLISEMLTNIILGNKDSADLLVFSKKGNDVYLNGYSAEQQKFLTYRDNPFALKTNIETTAQAAVTKLLDEGVIKHNEEVKSDNPDDWRLEENVKTIIETLSTKYDVVVYANYIINADKFAEIPALPAPEKTAIEKANEAIKKSGYAGESITKALAAIGGLDVDTLVYKENGAVVATKTYAYDPAKKEFKVVDLADKANLSSDLVYVVNTDTAINNKMTKIYINTAKDNAIARANFVRGKSFKAAFTMVEIGGSVAKVGSLEDWRAGDGCFSNCATIQKIYIGSNVEEIGVGSFDKTGVTEIYYNARKAQIGRSSLGLLAFARAGSKEKPVKLIIGKDVLSVPILFADSEYNIKEFYVGSVVFEEDSTCTTIEAQAFMSFDITEITLPKTITNINGSGQFVAFRSCKNLAKISLHKGQKITFGTGVQYDTEAQESSSSSVKALEEYMNGDGRFNITDAVPLKIEVLQ